MNDKIEALRAEYFERVREYEETLARFEDPGIPFVCGLGIRACQIWVAYALEGNESAAKKWKRHAKKWELSMPSSILGSARVI